MNSSSTKIICAAILLILSHAAAGSRNPALARTSPRPFRLYGHVPDRAIAAARWKGRLGSETALSMTIALPLRNQQELQVLLSRLYDVSDPLYGRYLSPQEFTDRFGPTQADYDAVAGYALSLIHI